MQFSPYSLDGTLKAHHPALLDREGISVRWGRHSSQWHYGLRMLSLVAFTSLQNTYSIAMRAGYMGTASMLEAAADLVRRLREQNPALQYCELCNFTVSSFH